MKSRVAPIVLSLLIFIGSAAGVQAQNLFVYVDDTAPGVTQDGASWDTAYLDIQPAIDAALNPSIPADRRVVVVAEGFYEPTTAFAPGSAGDLLDLTILIRGDEDVELRGGFLGGSGETDPDSPDGAFNKTVLSGFTSSGRVRHVFSHDSSSATDTVVHGFSIEGGRGFGPSSSTDTVGAGAFLMGNGDIEFERVRFRDNIAQTFGGGIYISKGGAAVKIKRCTVRDNIAQEGAGLYYRIGMELAMANVTFRDNGQTVAKFGTGGVVTQFGGAIRVLNDTNIDAANCVIFDNSATGAGGGIYYTPNFGPSNADYIHQWKNCTIAYNRVGVTSGSPMLDSGSGIHIEPGNHDGLGNIQECRIFNCIIYSNQGGNDIAALGVPNVIGIRTEVRYSDIGTKNITSQRYTEDNVIDALPQFINVGARNLRLRVDLLGSTSSPCIDNGSDPLRGDDRLDLNSNGGTGDLLPLDRVDSARLIDILSVSGSFPGSGSIDMGAYEATEPIDAPQGNGL